MEPFAQDHGISWKTRWSNNDEIYWGEVDCSYIYNYYKAVIVTPPDDKTMISLASRRHSILDIEIRDAQLLSSAALSIIANVGKSLTILSIQNIQASVMHRDECVWIYTVLKTCPALTALKLAGTHFPPEALAYIESHGTNLKVLHLAESIKPGEWDADRVTDDSLKYLNALTKLERLGISCFQKLSPNCISTIRNFKNLKGIRIDAVPCVDDAFVMQLLKGFNSVKGLGLTRVKITEKTLPIICDLRKLETLSLKGCGEISGEKLPQLNTLTSLTDLNLSDTQADDNALRYAPPNLKSFSIDRCLLTKSAIQSYCQSNPSVTLSATPIPKEANNNNNNNNNNNEN
jgi:hypothetical protein